MTIRAWSVYIFMLLGTATCGLAAGNCEEGWIENAGHCYFVSGSKTTWHDAKRECQQIGANLVSVLDSDEANFLSTITDVSHLDYWIGLQRINTTSGWQWVDGNAVSYTNWLLGEPTETGNCTKITVNDKWTKANCMSSTGVEKRIVSYVCKTGASQENEQETGESKTTRYTKRQGKELVIPLVLAALFIVLVIVIDVMAIYFCRRMKTVTITRPMTA